MLILLIDLLLYYITNWKIFYYIAWLIIVGWFSVLAFGLGVFISVYY